MSGVESRHYLWWRSRISLLSEMHMLVGGLYVWIFLACGKRPYLPTSYIESSGKLPDEQLSGGLCLWDELLTSVQVSEVCHISSTCSFVTSAEQFHFASSFICLHIKFKRWVSYIWLSVLHHPRDCSNPWLLIL